MTMNCKTDSRKVVPGDTFIALRGIDMDGHNYIKSAIEAGAVKIIAEEDNDYGVETVVVENTRDYLIQYLQRYYNSYLEKMKFIGITGTNGKTTTAFLIYQGLCKLGKKCAYIGTIGFYLEKKVRSLVNTTPDVMDLYMMYLEAYEAGCEYVVLEASSQGLCNHRVEGILFDSVVFTNLTPDHLDWHKSMGNYALAKQLLFQKLKANGKAIVNFDDSYKEYFLLPENENITYGFDGGDYQILDYRPHLDGGSFSFKISYNGNIYELKTNLWGKYNMYNILVTFIVLQELGILVEDITRVIHKLEAPDGRMERISYLDNTIVIDYAHSTDAIEKLVGAVKEVMDGDIYVVFGCTGDRDRMKRPIMTKLVTNVAKYAIITSDDLHNESFEQIVSDMTSELENTNYEICKDRKIAIEKGISLLHGNSILLVLGKGHEDVMIIKDQRIPFHDKKVILECLETLKQSN